MQKKKDLEGLNIFSTGTVNIQINNYNGCTFNNYTFNNSRLKITDFSHSELFTKKQFNTSIDYSKLLPEKSSEPRLLFGNINDDFKVEISEDSIQKAMNELDERERYRLLAKYLSGKK